MWAFLQVWPLHMQTGYLSIKSTEAIKQIDKQKMWEGKSRGKRRHYEWMQLTIKAIVIIGDQYRWSDNIFHRLVIKNNTLVICDYYVYSASFIRMSKRIEAWFRAGIRMTFLIHFDEKYSKLNEEYETLHQVSIWSRESLSKSVESTSFVQNLERTQTSKFTSARNIHIHICFGNDTLNEKSFERNIVKIQRRFWQCCTNGLHALHPSYANTWNRFTSHQTALNTCINMFCIPLSCR